jgi:hypothetical protein
VLLCALGGVGHGNEGDMGVCECLLGFAGRSAY